MGTEDSVADIVEQHGQSCFCVSVNRCCLILNTNRNDSCLALSVPLSAFRRMGHGVGQLSTHTKKCKSATKNTRNPKISGVFWSCWAVRFGPLSPSVRFRMWVSVWVKTTLHIQNSINTPLCSYITIPSSPFVQEINKQYE